MTVLTAVMIGGVVLIIALLVTRLNSEPTPLPDRIELPAGVSAVGYMQSADWYGVVTDDDRILIFDQADGELIQETAIVRPE